MIIADYLFNKLLFTQGDAYTATKGATISLTRSMSAEYGPENIRVNCIAPAAIMTEMVKESSLNFDTFDEASFLKLRSPLRRYGSAEEIAQVALFLASDESSYINGAIIVADGGLTINGEGLQRPVPRQLRRTQAIGEALLAPVGLFFEQQPVDELGGGGAFTLGTIELGIEHALCPAQAKRGEQFADRVTHRRRCRRRARRTHRRPSVG